MYLDELTEEEFRLFADNHPLKSFVQTPELAKVRKNGGMEVYYVGLKKSKKILCATMMLAGGTFLGKKVFYAPKGVLIDFQDKELVKTFILELKKFIKGKNGYVFRMDPYYELRERDIDGNIVEGGFDHTDSLEYLKSLGFNNSKNDKQIKWMFAIDIENKTIDELRKDFRQNTRNIINKTNKMGIIVRELEYEELHLFKELTNETSSRKNFNDRPLSYYQDMYKFFKPLNQIKCLVAEIHLKDYINILEIEKKELQERFDKLTDSKANVGKKKEINVSIESISKKIKEALEIIKEDGEVLILSGGMFILYGDEVVYLFSGNYKKYMNFNAQYKIQWEMINFAVDHKYKRYNFYGITGNFDKNDKDYGIYEFKKGFNGYVMELMDEVELPITYHYNIHKILSNLKAKLKGNK